MTTTPQQKQILSDWFASLQRRICVALEEIEQEYQSDILPGQFHFKPWIRDENGGGGTMGIMNGAVFEKAGVNV